MFDPIYKKIASQIEADISAGKWQEKLPGENVLGREYSVAPRTASKAVKVLAERGLVTTHGTRGTFITARTSNRPVYKTIGIVGFYSRTRGGAKLAHVEALLKNYGYSLLLLGLSEGLDHPSSHLHQMPVDGFVFANSTLTPQVVVNLRSANIPFVSLSRVDDIPGVPWVDFNNEHGLEMAIEHLSSLGHHRIAYIGFRRKMADHQERLHAAYKRAMEKLGGYDPALWAMEGDQFEYYKNFGDEYYRHYGQDSAQKLLILDDPPTACVVDEYVKEGVQDTLNDLGRTVPQDFSICARLPESKANKDSFYTSLVIEDSQRFALAVKELLTLIVDPARTPLRELVEHRLVIKKSTGKLEQQILAPSGRAGWSDGDSHSEDPQFS